MRLHLCPSDSPTLLHCRCFLKTPLAPAAALVEALHLLCASMEHLCSLKCSLLPKHDQIWWSCAPRPRKSQICSWSIFMSWQDSFRSYAGESAMKASCRWEFSQVRFYTFSAFKFRRFDSKRSILNVQKLLVSFFWQFSLLKSDSYSCCWCIRSRLTSNSIVWICVFFLFRSQNDRKITLESSDVIIVGQF